MDAAYTPFMCLFFYQKGKEANGTMTLEEIMSQYDYSEDEAWDILRDM